jgi:NADPH2 dehydrogenase
VSLLLSPITIGSLSLKNRVVMAPMCMYEVKKEDGIVTPFHFAHYGARAIANVGLIIIEATAVQPDGRITQHDLGLWNDKQTEKFSQLVDSLHYLGSKVGVQLAHAGRKAIDAHQPVAPSAIAFNASFKMPKALSVDEIKQIRADFVAASKRAQQAGVDVIEIHGAHGYLISEFLSPLSNQRNDEYGGALSNRYRLLHEITTDIRAHFSGSLWVRLSLSDYDKSGQQNSIADWQQVCQWLERDGIDVIDVSTGGVMDYAPDLPIHGGYQTPFATAMKQAVKIPVATVGLLDSPDLAEYILQTGQADLILEGRVLLRNTNWLADAAQQLHDHHYQPFNNSYQRGQLK